MPPPSTPPLSNPTATAAAAAGPAKKSESVREREEKRGPREKMKMKLGVHSGEVAREFYSTFERAYDYTLPTYTYMYIQVHALYTHPRMCATSG